ncbi:MAG: OmpA family protein [Pseudomonadota bacterium]
MRALLLVAVATGALAQEVPDPGAPSGAVRTAERVELDARYPLPIGAATGEGLVVEPLRGQLTWQAFRIEDPPGLPAVIDGYRARLTEQGFAERFSCAAAACGGLAFRLAVPLLPAPGMLADGDALEQLSMSRGGDAPAHVSVLASRVFGRVYIQTVTVLPAEPPAVAVEESPPLTARPVTATAETEDLSARLTADGHAVLDGLDFEPGGSRLAAASEPALAALVAVLEADPDLAIVVVGHTDNQGSLDLNRRLSQERAAAVRAALIERGVASERVTAEGVGFLAPLTSNATEDGRAVNRRVDVVVR